jgi:serine protease inhibitor
VWYSHLARAEKSNLFFSPYSISSDLAMTYAGACGRTEQEMAKVLRFPMEQDKLHSSTVENRTLCAVRHLKLRFLNEVREPEQLAQRLYGI